MTISTTYAPVQYTGNAVTTAFSFPYPFFNNTDLLVYLDGVLQSSGYSVSGGSGASGTVTFSSAPASGVVVTISLSLPYTQLDNYVENQAFPAETLEAGLDKAAIRDQQLNNRLNRSLVFPDTLSGSLVGVLPQPEDGKLLVWSGSTGSVGNAAVADISTSINTVLTGLANGDFLTYNGTNWVNKPKTAVPIDGVQTTGASGVILKNSAGATVLTAGASAGTTVTCAGAVNITGALGMTGKVNTAASATGGAGLNVPHGTAPTSPTNGDFWTTTSGAFVRINGSTVSLNNTGKRILQRAYKSTTTNDSTALTVPDDNTIPQNGECKVGLTADAFTPTSATSKLRISYSATISNSSASTTGMLLLFKDSDAGALKTSPALVGSGDPTTISAYYEMTAGTTSAITFKLYFGGISGTTYFLSDNGTVKWGGTVNAHILIEEIEA